MTDRLRTAIIGFGKVAAGYAEDARMAHYVPFATHAQVLAAHPAFQWDAVVDPSPTALTKARTQWSVPLTFRTVTELAQAYAPQVAILATPPETRLEIVRQLPTLRAILVEKPLGTTPAQSQTFLDYCCERHILVQVNLWRRADELYQRLANGLLEQKIGQIQTIFGLYGNGLLNNGTHLIDFVRMLAGEVKAAHILPEVAPYPAGPIAGDVNVPFSLQLANGATAQISPLRFEHYREVSLDVWGTQGRLEILQEGLHVRVSQRADNRSLQNERELATDKFTLLAPTVGHAFYRMADDLVNALRHGTPLCSPGESALKTARLVEAISKPF